jgi:signal transduction histidine kinase
MARYLELGRELDAAENLDDLGPVILDRFADLAGAERAVLFAVDSERGLAPEVIAERGLTEPPPLLPEDGVVGRTLAEGRVTRLGHHDASRLLVREPGAGPELLVPLVHGGTPAGLLVLGRREGRPPDDVIDELASQAQQAAAALASAVALRRARENATVIRAVLDTTPDAIALLDSGGRTVLENPPMRTVRQALVESVRTPGGGYRTNVSVSGSDPSAEVRDELELLGTGRTFARYAAPVRAQDDGLIGRLVVLREITGEREAERLKDEFFALVSHELRTPLTSIIGYLELVLDETEDNLPEDQRRYLEVVQRNATRLLRLVGDLLFVAQVEAGKLSLDPGSVDLGRLVEEAVEASRPRAEARGITLSVEVEPLQPTWGDRDRLGQVLDNLVTNALKFTPEGGEVTLRLRRDDGRVDLEVADTGMGIPEDEQSRLFDRFFRASTATAQAVPGVGLGLTIVKAIVEAHGGRVSLHSVEGEGTTFRVRLPLRAPEAAREDAGAGGVAPRQA